MARVTNAEREALIEEVVSAFRERDPHGAFKASPAFYDLSEADRARAFDEAVVARAMESALDPRGLSSTARAVLRVIGSVRDEGSSEPGT